jgi:hypothetical protein
MTADAQKVTAAHLKRNAYLYIRQSTPRQVLENVESTKRQYALQQRAIALGWPAERIVVIDNDWGHSSSSAVDREGFPKLVVMTSAAIEVSLAVQQELQTRLEEVDRLRKQQVERARYEAELAQCRYMRVNPDHRLVADTLEADWNYKLRAFEEAQTEYQQHRPRDRVASMRRFALGYRR